MAPIAPAISVEKLYLFNPFFIASFIDSTINVTLATNKDIATASLKGPNNPFFFSSCIQAKPFKKVLAIVHVNKPNPIAFTTPKIKPKCFFMFLNIFVALLFNLSKNL